MLATTAHIGVHVRDQAAPGATGVVIALHEGATGANAVAQLAAAAAAVFAAGVPLPVLLLLAGPAGAGEGASVEAVAREAAAALASEPALPFAAVRAVSIDAGNSGTAGSSGLFSEAALLDGLRWLAERAPPQPRLEVGPVAGPVTWSFVCPCVEPAASDSVVLLSTRSSRNLVYMSELQYVAAHVIHLLLLSLVAIFKLLIWQASLVSCSLHRP